MRLIDVSVLKEWVENWFTKNRLYHPYAKKNDIPITELYDILEQMPTVEDLSGFCDKLWRGAYERGKEEAVIRCKDCEWFRKEYGWNCIEYTVCRVSPTHHPIRREEDFCSYAERRTDETD